jgi:hypothetical protein
MNVNPIAPRTITGPLLPIAPVQRAATAPLAPEPEPAPAPAPQPQAKTPTANMTFNTPDVDIEALGRGMSAPPVKLTQAQLNAREARLIAIANEAKGLADDAVGDKYRLEMEKHLLEQEVAHGAVPEPARSAFFSQVAKSAQYKTLQHQVLHAKDGATTNRLWDQIQSLAAQIKGREPENLLGVKDAGRLNGILTLQNLIANGTPAEAKRASLQLKLIKHEDENGPMPAASRQAFMDLANKQAEYQALQTQWVNETNPAAANALFGRLQALQAQVKGVMPEDLLGLKSNASIAKVLELQAKLPTASEEERYRIGMQIRLLRQEDNFGPMPMNAKLQFVQQVNLQAEKKSLYAQLWTATKEAASAIYDRLAVLNEKTKGRDPDDLIGVRDSKTLDRIAEIQSQMVANKPGDTYRKEQEIALLRFEDQYGKVNGANKKKYNEKVDQMARYQDAVGAYGAETNPARSNAIFADIMRIKDEIGGSDPSFFLIAEPA